MGKVRKSFSSGVAREIDHYVYRLIDPRNGQTFYVGRGQGDRVYAHANADLVLNEETDPPTEKLEIIHEIRLAGLEPGHVVHRHGMSEETAKEVEAALIDAMRGLTNLATGEDSRKRGPATAEQLEERYAPPPMKPDPHHRLIFIKTKEQTINRWGSVYEAVRCCWTIKCDKANRADYVLAIVDGTCVAVFEDCTWRPEGRTLDERKNKFGFVGRQVFVGDAFDRYVRKKLPDDYRKKGMAAPVLFWPRAGNPAWLKPSASGLATRAKVPDDSP